MKKSRVLILVSLLLIASLMAAAGSGAIDIFSANRSAGIKIVNDSEAYLAISSNSGFALQKSNGEFHLDFTENNQGVAGDGLNPKAFTQFDEVFTITNQSDRSIYVWFESDNFNTAAVNGVAYYANENPDIEVIRVDQWFYRNNPDGLALLSGGVTKFVDGEGRSAYVKLDAGEAFSVKMIFKTTSNYGNAGTDMSHTLKLKAGSTAPTHPGQYYPPNYPR